MNFEAGQLFRTSMALMVDTRLLPCQERDSEGNCSDLRTGDPLLKKLRKTFTVGTGGDIGLKYDCPADST